MEIINGGDVELDSPRIKTTVTIRPPRFAQAEFLITGVDGPYCQNKFSNKAKKMIEDKQRAGTRAKKGGAKEARNFEADFLAAQYKSREGWNGIPAAAFRMAMISACRLVQYKMTLAKMSLFIIPDGVDVEDGTPLVRIMSEAAPVMRIHPLPNFSGVVDLRARPFWDHWHALVKVRYDSDLFTLDDVTNLLSRVGQQVGIGEGRNDSKNSAGQGWGSFRLLTEEEAKEILTPDKHGKKAH